MGGRGVDSLQLKTQNSKLLLARESVALGPLIQEEKSWILTYHNTFCILSSIGH